MKIDSINSTVCLPNTDYKAEYYAWKIAPLQCSQRLNDRWEKVSAYSGSATSLWLAQCGDKDVASEQKIPRDEQSNTRQDCQALMDEIQAQVKQYGFQPYLS